MSDYYKKLGVRPVINGVGNMTVLGGSIISPDVKRAMDEVGDSFVEMQQLQDRAGEYIAHRLDVEAAHITSGAAAALALSTAACISGMDSDKIARLPNTTGMKNEVLIQKKQRYVFDRLFTVPGAILLEVGDENRCTIDQLQDAIGPNTVAVAYRVLKDQPEGELSLRDVVNEAHSRNLPVIADAASQIYPIDYFRETVQSADLVCIGAKYMGAPHSSGLVCGTKELIQSVKAQDFIGFETEGHVAFGRAMKIDRQEIIGVVAALDEWLSIDHEERLLDFEAKVSVIRDILLTVPNVEVKVEYTSAIWIASIYVSFDTEVLGKNSDQVVEQLFDGDPRIRISTMTNNSVVVNPITLKFGEDQILANRLKHVLTA